MVKYTNQKTEIGRGDLKKTATQIYSIYKTQALSPKGLYPDLIIPQPLQHQFVFLILSSLSFLASGVLFFIQTRFICFLLGSYFYGF